MIVDFEKIKERAMARIGCPPMGFELDSETLELLYEDAQRKYDFYRDMSKKEMSVLDKIKTTWVEGYFQTNVKEAIGNVRGKFSGEAHIPGATLNIEYKHLLSESASERKTLIKMIMDENFSGEESEKEKDLVLIALYLNIGNIEAQEAEQLLKRVASYLSESYPSYIKHYIFPVRNQDTKVELIYPGYFGGDKEKLYNTLEMMKDIDTRINEYCSNEKQN